MNFLHWKYVSEADVKELESLYSQEEIRNVLTRIFSINYDNCKKNEIAADFYFHNFIFCKECGFHAKQTSTFMSMMKQLFSDDMHKVASNNSMTVSFDQFQKMLMTHSMEVPPKSCEIFIEEDVSKIINFVLGSYYKHYSLYKYIFSKRQIMVLKQLSPNEVESVSVVPPLREALLIPSDK